MKKIIVPVDFSDCSINAVHYAVDMTDTVKADILLLHTIKLPIAISEMAISADTIDIMTDDAENEIQKLRTDLLASAKNPGNITTLVMVGDLLTELTGITGETDVFAIVMGIQAAGTTEDLIFGSNALAALHGLSSMVVIVPQDAKFTSVKRIGLAYDLRNMQQVLPVKKIESLCTLLGSTLNIIYIAKPNASNLTVQPESERLRKELASLHPKVNYLSNDNIETGILEFVRKEHIDLLLVLPQKYSFFNSIFHRSVSKKVVSHLQIPLMTLHV